MGCHLHNTNGPQGDEWSGSMGNWRGKGGDGVGLEATQVEVEVADERESRGPATWRVERS
jgi:hypothetical protein